MQGMQALPPRQRIVPLALNRAALLRHLRVALQNPNFTELDLQNITDLDLRHLNIVSIDPDTFTGLVNLEIIRLDHNHIGAIQPQTFANLPNLHTLFLNFNNIQTLSTNSFNNLRALRLLQLNRNQIAIINNPTTFNNLPSLQLINLNGNPLNVAQVSDPAFHLVHPNLEIEFAQQRRRLPLLPPPAPVPAPVPALVPGASTCPVCLEYLVGMEDQAGNPIPIYTLPCGHVLCATCYNGMPPSGVPFVKRCPNCRTAAPVAGIIRTYLGGYKEKYLKYKEKYLQLKNKL